MDLPIKFNVWKWFSIAMVIVAAIFIYRTCNPPNTPALPAVIPIKEQQKTVKADSVASKSYTDSVTRIIKEKDKAIEVWYNEWKASEGRYNDLEKGFTDLANKEVPDTCKAMQQAYILQLNKLISENRKKDYSCGNTIASLKAQSAQKDLLIKKGLEDWKKLKVNFDTALAQQAKLTKAVSSLKPKREVYAGIMAMGSEIKPFEGVGVNLGLRNKRGSQYEVFALQFNSGIHYGISFKKTLFRF